MASEPAANNPTQANTPRRRGKAADPEATRRALIDAAFETLRDDGFRGATARGIADRVPCNQATIYYHFGGIPPLLVEALRVSSERRLARYREVLEGIVDAPTAVATLHTLHAEDIESGHYSVLSELVGGVTAEPELRPGIVAAIGEWLAFIADLLRSTLGNTPFSAAIPYDALADLVFSLFLGVEIRSKLDGDDQRFTRGVNIGQLLVTLLPGVSEQTLNDPE